MTVDSGRALRRAAPHGLAALATAPVTRAAGPRQGAGDSRRRPTARRRAGTGVGSWTRGSTLAERVAERSPRCRMPVPVPVPVRGAQVAAIARCRLAHHVVVAQQGIPARRRRRSVQGSGPPAPSPSHPRPPEAVQRVGVVAHSGLKQNDIRPGRSPARRLQPRIPTTGGGGWGTQMHGAAAGS